MPKPNESIQSPRAVTFRIPKHLRAAPFVPHAEWVALALNAYAKEIADAQAGSDTTQADEQKEDE